MKISELSRRSGVSVASIKFYVREGLLPSGIQTAANQADYSDAHERRLRLIRALIDVGGLTVARVRTVLGAIDDDSTTLHDAFGEVMHGLGDPAAGEPSPAVASALEEVLGWIDARGWTIESDAPAPLALATLVSTLRDFGMPATIHDFDDAADAALVLAEVEVAYARSMADRTAAVETMLIGTVVYERAFAEVRRIVLEATSARLEQQAGAPPKTAVRRRAPR